MKEDVVNNADVETTDNLAPAGLDIRALKDLLKHAWDEIAKNNYADAEKAITELLMYLENPVAEYQPEEVKIRSRARTAMATIIRHRSGYDSAIHYLSEILRRSEAINDEAGIASAFYGLGYQHLENREYDSAMEKYEKALVLYERLDHKSSVASVLGNIGVVHYRRHEDAKALEYYSRALALAEELGDKEGIIRWVMNIGFVHLRQADYAQCLVYFGRALSVAEDNGNTGQRASCLYNMGLALAYLSEDTKALEYSGKALALYRELGDKSGEVHSLVTIGQAYRGLGNIEAALEYSANAYSIAEELGDEESGALLVANIGELYADLKDFNQALEYLHKAVALDEALNNTFTAAHNLGYCYQTLGNIYANPSFEGQNIETAESYYLKSNVCGEESNNKKVLYENSKSLANMYERQHRWSEAFSCLKKYIDLKEAVDSDEAKKQAQNLEHKRHLAEREKQGALEKASATARIEGQQLLLYKVLPSTIADRLLAGEEDIADYLPSISILFADIVGFTPISANMPAHLVVRFLNFVFGKFDAIMKENGCEKIKTIGDGYMAVSGMPLQCEDHAERIARAALAMQEDILLPDDIRKYIDEGTVFNIRIGIHTGAAVGGIIGDERFVYDVYSDAVNIAARMESTGEPGMIHVSNDFALHLENRMSALKNTSMFSLTRRGQTEIKGKGVMRTYFLNG